MKKFKLMTGFIITAVLASTVVGCGSKAAETSAGGDTKQAVAQKEDFSGVKLRVSGYRNLKTDSLNDAYGKGADKFIEKYAGSSVEYLVQGGSGDAEAIVAAVASGDPWELQLVIGPVIPKVFNNDLYQPINDYVDVNDKTFSKVTMDAVKWQGKYYGVSSVMMNDFFALQYNENLFKDYGIKTPNEYIKENKWNWDSYLTMVSELGKQGLTGVVDYDKPQLTGKYMQKWKDDGTIDMTFDGQESREWLDFWKKQMYDYKDTLKKGWHSNLPKREQAFIAGVIPNIMVENNNNKANSSDVIRTVPFPTKDGKLSVYEVDYHFAIPKGAKNQKAAMELAKYMIQSRNENQEKLYKDSMPEEDFTNLKTSLDNGYMVHSVPDTGIEFKTLFGDIQAGKPVSTVVSENIEKFKAAADAWNKSVKK